MINKKKRKKKENIKTKITLSFIFYFNAFYDNNFI